MSCCTRSLVTMAPAAGKHGHAMPHLTGHDRRCLKGLPHQSRQYLASRDTLFVSQLLHGDQNVVFYGKRRPHASDATASDAARQFSAVRREAAVRRLVQSRGGSGKPEYYDRAADVGAQTDRAASEPVRFAELPKLFDDWNAEQVEPGPNPKILTHLGDWPTRPLATCQARRGTSMWKWCSPRRSNCLSVMSSMSARTLATIFAATSRWCFSRNDSK